MKILSDFDGVLTDLHEETQREREIYLEKLVREAGIPTQDIPRLVEEAETAMDREPHKYGWFIKGRISAYCNEDAFIRLNAMGSLFDGRAEAGDPILAPALDRLRSKDKSFFKLVIESYNQMTEETAKGKRKPMDPESTAALKSILDKGHDVVVVSNSGTDRIMQILEDVGFRPEAYRPGSSAPLRVRGHAEKFILGDKPETFAVGPFQIDVDRPSYRKILLEEKPDAVVGDVFSLDLALAFHLKKTEPGFSHLRPLLRLRSYSPRWVTSYLTGENESRETNHGILKRYAELLALGAPQ